ncbi:MAG: hypothetical protein WAW80_01410 [Candidatus Saccharimonadales bacterium]
MPTKVVISFGVTPYVEKGLFFDSTIDYTTFTVDPFPCIWGTDVDVTDLSVVQVSVGTRMVDDALVTCQISVDGQPVANNRGVGSVNC